MAEKILNLLDDIQKGISPSYMGQFSKINNVDIDSVQGVVFAKNQLLSYPTNFTVALDSIEISGFSDGDDYINLSSSGDNTSANLFVGQAIKMTTTSSLASPLTDGTVYYISEVGANKIKLATTIKNANDGTHINLTNTGSAGTHMLVPQYMKQIKHYVKDTTYGEYAVDSDNVVWYKTTSGWTVITGNESGGGYGLAIWKGYLFVPRASEVNVYGPLSAVGDTATWSNSFWTSITSATNHPCFVGQDGNLYIGCGKDLASIQEDTTFSPSDAGTYTTNNSALDIPNNILFIDELSNTLLVASDKVIYPWDGVSPSYDSPVFLNETMVAMRVYNNLLYFIDIENVIWACNGSSIAKQGKLSQSDFSSKLNITDKIGIINSKLYFGAYSLTSTETDSSGVYSFNPATGVIFQEYKSQSGQTANSRADCYDGTFTFYEPDLGTPYEASIQKVDTSSIGRYATTSFETGFLQIGTNRKKTTLSNFEIVFTKELSTGLAITLKYRLNLSDSWTTIGSVSYTNDGAIHSQVIDNSSVEADQIQFRVELTSRGTGFDTTPNLKAIYVR